MPQTSASLDFTLRALADPTRRAVIEQLSRCPASVSEIAKPFDMALPSFMQHLALLERHGLVRTKKQGRVRMCEIVPEPFEEMAHWLAQQRALWTARLDRLDSHLLTLKTGDRTQ
ncbi:MAG: helix-turn-helix transcriptional regulator [Proteobacteria bacterium]|nr:helix-turn-helix transcriptional regulator [Pseudomonadota bacterium]